MNEEVWKITEGKKTHLENEVTNQWDWEDKRQLAETYIDKENRLKVADCHVLETMFGIKVAGPINSAWIRLYN